MSRNQLAATITLFLIFSSAIAAPGSWSINGPDGGEIQDVVASKTVVDRVYTSTFNGMFRSDDAGLSWQAANTGLPSLITQKLLLVGSVPERLYTVSAGKPHVTTDGGANWYERATGLPIDVNVAQIISDPVTPNRMYLTTYLNGLWTSANAGVNWSKIGIGMLPDTLDALAIDPADPNEILVGVNNGTDMSTARIWQSTDAGASWTAASISVIDNDGIRVLSYATASDLYAGSQYGNVYRSSDGLTWTETVAYPSVGGITDFYTVFGDPDLIVTGKQGVVFSNDGGASFTDFTAGITSNGIDPNGVNGIDQSTSGVLYAAADYSGFYAYNSITTMWENRSEGLASTNIRVVTLNPDLPDVIYAGYGDAFLTPSPAFYYSLDGGGNWTVSNTGLDASSLRAIAVDPQTSAVAGTTVLYASGVGNDGICGMFKSNDGGGNWITINSGLPFDSFSCNTRTIRTVLLDPSSSVLPGGPLQTVFLGSSGSVNYDTTTGVPTVVGHRVYKSTDAGANWTPSDNGFGLAPYDSGTFQQAQTVVIQMVMDPSTPTTLYAGTFLTRDESRPLPLINNGVFKTTDGGATWVHMSNGLPRLGPGGTDPHRDVLSLAISTSDPNVLYASARREDFTSEVYKTIDGGATWFFAGAGILPTADTRALAVDPLDSNVVYAATGGTDWNPGGIYRSQNGGVSWVSISSDLERSSATALALDRSGTNPRLFVGTRGGVAEIELLTDSDTDSAEDSEEAAAPNGGDGNDDGVADADQTDVASLSFAGLNSDTADAASGNIEVATGYITIEVTPISGTCEQLANARIVPSAELPIETNFELPLEAIRFELVDCQQADVKLIYHGAAFDDNFTLRNYGPTVPGDENTVQWYSFDQNATVSSNAVTIRLTDNQLGDTRPIVNAMMFQGAITLGERLFRDDFEN